MHKRCLSDRFGYCSRKSPPYLEKPVKTRLNYYVGGTCSLKADTCKSYLTHSQEMGYGKNKKE